MKPTSIATLLALLIASFAGPATAGDITVRLVGLVKGEGLARAALYANASAYDAGDSVAGASEKVEADTLVLVFKDVAPGTYGISAFQDVNENAKIDANFLGIPKEAYGFSNNARGSFGPASFEEMAFEVGDGPLELEIELRR